MQKEELTSKLNYAYIRRIKKWMFCPSCKEGKMSIHKEKMIWKCEDCGYELSDEDFKNDYIFWFCDECNTFLNNQEGFDINSSKHVCTNCGFENDITENNVKGICVDCGKTLEDNNATLCPECKSIRKQKAKNTWKIVGKVAAVTITATTAGIIAYVLKNADAEKYSSEWLKSVSDEVLEEEREKVRVAFCSSGDDEKLAIRLQNLLYRFDDEMSKRAWGDEIPHAPSIHREHGWYLPNDD